MSLIPLGFWAASGAGGGVSQFLAMGQYNQTALGVAYEFGAGGFGAKFANGLY